MQLILSAISAGGVVGAADQYLCLLAMSVAARFGVVELMPPMAFMTQGWFIALVALLWVLTVAPAYSSAIAPGIMNVINAGVNFVSGFLVPVSSAMLSLASAGVMVNMNPELYATFEALQIFTANGSIGPGGVIIAGGSAAAAVTLTGMKAMAKPAIGASTGTAGHASAPLFATVEGIASLVLMGLAYALTQIDPALLIVLLVALFVAFAALLAYALYQLVRLKRGIGRMLQMAQEHPRAGLSVAVEFFVWGLGWMVWGRYGRGAIMMAVWAMALAVMVAIPGLFAFFPPLSLTALLVLLSLFSVIGFSTAGALMRTLETEVKLVQAEIAAANV